MLESYLESPTENNCCWFHFRQWTCAKRDWHCDERITKSCKNFSMSINLSKSNKLWFLTLPLYLNNNCKKLIACNNNLNVLFCIQIVFNFHSQLWRTGLPSTEITPFTHCCRNMIFILWALATGSVSPRSGVKFNSTGHLK